MIQLITALAAEARPIIDRFGLKACHTDQFFHLYENDDIRLIVSGIGKIAVAAATATLHTLADKTDTHAWLNIGIAGHADRPLGDCILGHKIIDDSTRNTWYPVIVFDPPCDTDDILTVDRPTDDYSGHHSTEMEAAGFYQTASRFTTAELVHCCKIISDNRERPAQHVTKQIIYDLIGNNLDTIEKIMSALQTLSEELDAIHTLPQDLEYFLGHWHFSRTQRLQLQRLLQRWQTLNPEESIWRPELKEMKHSKDVLQHLQNRIHELPVELI